MLNYSKMSNHSTLETINPSLSSHRINIPPLSAIHERNPYHEVKPCKLPKRRIRADGLQTCSTQSLQQTKRSEIKIFPQQYIDFSTKNEDRRRLIKPGLYHSLSLESTDRQEDCQTNSMKMATKMHETHRKNNYPKYTADPILIGDSTEYLNLSYKANWQEQRRWRDHGVQAKLAVENIKNKKSNKKESKNTQHRDSYGRRNKMETTYTQLFHKYRVPIELKHRIG